MALPFISRAPSAKEVEVLRLLLSTFCDGHGGLTSQGGSLPDWRQIERVVAAIFKGRAAENKGIFDVTILSDADANVDYGFSVKSKGLTRRTALADLTSGGRVYMELSNSPAKFWDALKRSRVAEADFRARRRPDVIGNTVLQTVQAWHREAAAAYGGRHPQRTLDLAHSAYLVFSYKKREEALPEYQVHSFDLGFPAGIRWRYKSENCLSGEDPNHPGETLFDWYAVSGGQLKYYPRATRARFSSPIFTLLPPKPVSLLEKAAMCFPKEWAKVAK
jgi:hypothetical protein